MKVKRKQKKPLFVKLATSARTKRTSSHLYSCSVSNESSGQSKFVARERTKEKEQNKEAEQLRMLSCQPRFFVNGSVANR